MKVVEVVLSVTVPLPLGGLGIVGSHTDPPSVVLTRSDENISTGSVDVSLEKSSSGSNVEVNVVTANDQRVKEQEVGVLTFHRERQHSSWRRAA